MLEHCYFIWNFFVTRSFLGYQYFPPVTLTFVSGLLSENFNLSHNCGTVCARIFIIHKDIPCDKTFLLVLNVLNIDISSIFYKTKHYLLLNNKYLNLPAYVHFFVTRSFYCFHGFCPSDLRHLWTWQLLGTCVFHKKTLFVRISWSHSRLFHRLEMLSILEMGCKGPIFSSHSNKAEGVL